MRLLRPVTLVLGAALVAGCGSAGAPHASSGTAPLDRLTPVEAVGAASDRTVAARSSKFTLSSAAVVAGRSVTFSGTGAFDYARRLGSMTFTIPAAAGGATTTFEERLLGDTLYLALPNQTGVYYKLSLSQLGGTSFGGSADPTTGLAVLHSATGVTSVGHETLRGVTTTHYTGTYDVTAALAKAQGPVRDLLAGTLKSTNLKTVPFDAFIDEQGRLARMVQHITVGSVASAAATFQTTTTLDFFDFGTPVTVEAPPAAQVKDGAPLLNFLGGKPPAHN